LLELSAVAIPANPNALALGLKSGAIEKSDLIDMEELLRQTLNTSRSVWSACSLLPLSGPKSQLLQMARQLHAILKS
jgi:hypothetical protein